MSASPILVTEITPSTTPDTVIAGTDADHHDSSFPPGPSSPQRPASESPRFSRLTIPKKYDNLPLITRLWLQSRVDLSPKGTGKSGSKSGSKTPVISVEGQDKAGDAGASDAHDAGPPLRASGRQRPLNLATIWLWLDISRALVPFLRPSVSHAHPFRVLVYILNMVMDKLSPTMKLYATSRLYDLVEQALSGSPVSWPTALRVAGSGLALTLFDDLSSAVCQQNSAILHQLVDYVLEKSYLSMQLDMPLAGADQLRAALLYEAGVFTGMECAPTYNEGPWGLINGLGGVFGDVLDIGARIALLVGAVGGWKEVRQKNPRVAALLVLAFAPIMLNHLRNWMFSNDEYDFRMDEEADAAENREYLMKEMATDVGYKQEVVLFGLRDWVLSRWDEAKKTIMRLQPWAVTSDRMQGIGFRLAREAVTDTFYVLLATKTIDVGLSLGSIHLYQSTASSLVYSFKGVARNFDRAYQSMFYAAAFAGSLVPFPRGLSIDYETTRGQRGMRIEAKDLSFTYPGADKPTLHGIDLSIEPGETLAIVGYNGGGKTTLVKVLMGLYDHSGELLINGTPVRDIEPSTLHRRTSALFQDFAKFNLSLQDNVGVGDVSRIDDAASVNAAIDAGGAQAVRALSGLDGDLDPYGQPKTYSKAFKCWHEEDDSDDEGSDDEDEDNVPATNELIVPSGGVVNGAVDNSVANGPPGADPSDNEVKGDAETPSVPHSSMPAISASTTPSPGTPVSDSGTPAKRKKPSKTTSLSGGQWQRVGLARAFMRAGEADLVVFDEPSAALDPRAEAELFTNIHGLSHAAGSTTIYISHRFNTVRRADRIALVDNGTIAEYGTHTQLMAKKGQYYDLFTMQAEGYLGGDGEA